MHLNWKENKSYLSPPISIYKSKITKMLDLYYIKCLIFLRSLLQCLYEYTVATPRDCLLVSAIHQDRPHMLWLSV